MKFKSESFRRISEGSKPGFKLRTVDTTLILIKGSGECSWGNTRGEKDEIIKNFNSATDLLLWPWVGQYRTDIFMLSQEDIDNHYK